MRKWPQYACGLIAVLGLGGVILGMANALRIQPVPVIRQNIHTPANGMTGLKQDAVPREADFRL
jgi:hypothetical protein